MFLWEELYNIGAHIKIADHWVPQWKHHNDMAIIDTLIKVQDKHKGFSSFVLSQHIVYANACRLWLKVTMLSDIVTNEGTHIVDDYLYGTMQKTTDIPYPY